MLDKNVQTEWIKFNPLFSGCDLEINRARKDMTDLGLLPGDISEVTMLLDYFSAVIPLTSSYDSASFCHLML